MYFPHSKHLHMTALVASPQDVRSCTHILPITEDRCSKLPMCVTPTTYHLVVFFPSVSVMHFLPRLCIVRSSHLCHF